FYKLPIPHNSQVPTVRTTSAVAPPPPRRHPTASFVTTAATAWTKSAAASAAAAQPAGSATAAPAAPTPCQSRPCANSALCRPAPNWVNFSCDCSTADGGFSGPLSLDDIDECQAAGRCDSDGTQRCLNTVGSFKCVCKPGFVGEHCDRRADRCASVVCLNGGWCDPADGSCRCQPEFDGFDCFRPARATTASRRPCRTLVDAYVCTCPPGYGGLDCEKVNACSNSSCLGRGTCRVEQRIAASAAAAAGQPDFRCDCHSGFGGQFCQDRIRGGAVLSRGSGCSDSLCSGVGRCFNDSGTILCQCPFGYSGRRCESPVNPCDSNPCRRGGTCVAGLANGDPTNYTCLCKPGFQGPHCEANINECANGGACDPRGTEVCIDGVASFTCRCLPGFTGQLCNRSIDYCLPTATPKPPRCLKRRRVPVGSAPTNARRRLRLPRRLPRAALSAHLRSNGGVCEIVGANRTRCICPPGTAGLRCEIDYINSCKSSASPTGESPCHGDQSECRDLPEGFRCRCQPGLCGPTCDRECPTLEEERSRSGDAGGCIAGYGDGLCQLECSDQRCLFDGGDCDASTSAPSDHEYESYCRDHFADGRCDSGCDTAAYLFDGGDCLPASSTGKLPPQPPTPPPPAGYLKLAVGGRNASGFRPDTAVGPAVSSDSRLSGSAGGRALGCLGGTVVLVLVYRLGLCHRPDRCYTSADYAAQILLDRGGTGRREAGRLWCPPGFQPLNSVSSSGGGCGCGHPDNECPGAAYSMQHRQHPLLLDDSFEQPAAKRSKRCCSTD
uniref:Notch n=1 Tax=Macrostomum lignano TaxID=282301 RepID=A0A1I8FU46_9PLAT